ncbi:hypothetical protein ACIP6P_08700 [Streptomyces sp. NPDC088729]
MLHPYLKARHLTSGYVGVRGPGAEQVAEDARRGHDGCFGSRLNVEVDQK